jgi:hypothetical protein
MMMAFIDAHREDLGIEPICRELAIAPSSYHEHAARRADPGRRPARARRDEEIREQIKRVHEASFGLYGARKVWHQMRRDGIMVAKCTVERLMRAMGLAGVRRGKKTVTTVSNPKAPCPLDKVNREFRVSRPNALWVVDFTYVHTWAGFVYVAFVIDAFARRIVGWKVSTSATAGFVLDALEQAIHARRPGGTVRNFVCGVAVEHQAAMARMNRSPKITANCALAIVHSRGGIVHSFSDRFKIRNRSLAAASSLGKCPRARTARRSLELSASMAFVV